MRTPLRRLLQECRDLFEFVLLPGLAGVLPWGLCLALFRRLSRWKFLYGAECDRAFAEAQARGWAGNRAVWLPARRLTTLMDHADQYLALTRSDAWLSRHVRVEGAWPTTKDPAVLCTFHWGAGMWALRHAAAAGLRPHMLVDQPTEAAFRGRRILRRYIVARIASIARILQRPTLDASTNLRAMLKAVRHGEQLMAVVDVPADQVNASQAIRLLGMAARVPRALFRIAVEQRIPVTVFVCGIDMATGQRVLRIRQLGVHEDIDRLIAEVFKHLEAALIENPAAWHLWGESQRFFRAE